MAVPPGPRVQITREDFVRLIDAIERGEIDVVIICPS
jgi:hypothetical protein